MIQRIACLFLVPVLFANQLLACCAHSHEGLSAATPHIHLSWDDGLNSHGHHHGHSHSHGHSHVASHSHHAPTNDNDVQHDSDLELRTDSLSDQHEDALIYCTDSNCVTHSKSDCLLDFCKLAIACESAAFAIPETADAPPQRGIEDARARYSCAIFLQIRSLRL